MNTFKTVTTVLLISLMVSICFGQFGIKKPEKGSKSSSGAELDVFLERVEVVKTNFQGATKCLTQSRNIIFDIIATDEQKTQIETLEKQRSDATSDSDKERFTVQINKLQDDEIARTKSDGQLEKTKLDNQQTINVVKVIFNISLAILKDKYAVDNAPGIITDGQNVIKSVSSNKMAAVKSATKIKEAQNSITNDMPAIIKEVPNQLITFYALLEATSMLKKNNDIAVKGVPTADDSFVPWEEN